MQGYSNFYVLQVALMAYYITAHESEPCLSSTIWSKNPVRVISEDNIYRSLIIMKSHNKLVNEGKFLLSPSYTAANFDMIWYMTD